MTTIYQHAQYLTRAKIKYELNEYGIDSIIEELCHVAFHEQDTDNYNDDLTEYSERRMNSHVDYINKQAIPEGCRDDYLE